MENNNDMGGMKDLMSKMMGGNENTSIPMMDMMSKMMPQGINMMFSGIPEEKRAGFAIEMIENIVEKGSDGMPEKEKSEFVDKIIKRIKPEK